MSFTDGKQFIVKQSHIDARGRMRPWFCLLCGGPFVVGDKSRFIYLNDKPAIRGNGLVCDNCDESDDAIKEKIESDDREYRRLRMIGYPCKH